MLKFASETDLVNTLLCLETKTSIMEERFWNDWGHLHNEDSDSLSDKMHEIGYEEDAVYKSFENHFGYKSLRSELDSSESVWLSDSLPDTLNIPDHIIGDVQVQTIMNEQGAFYVGNDLYMVRPNGDAYKINGGSVSIMQSILNGICCSPLDTTDSVDVLLADSGLRDGPVCRTARSIKAEWTYKWVGNVRYAMKYKSGWYNTFVFARYYADTDGYYWKNSKWKRYKNFISAEMGSSARKGRCNKTPVWVSDDKTKQSASDATAAKYLWFQVTYTKSNEFAANHKTKRCGLVAYPITWN